ncbi:YdhR family protein [Alphaproteobacteria bacterium]|nr:YdhR family protein [Alphaproteobacteria bacterium]
MIITIVTFNISSDLTDSDLKEKFLETSLIYKDTPGLIRKNYICDTSNDLAGGIYCFDNIENAKSWFDEDRVKWITDRFSAPDIKFYENPVIVDNNTNEIIS